MAGSLPTRSGANERSGRVVCVRARACAVCGHRTGLAPNYGVATSAQNRNAPSELMRRYR
jgi:hypothetical protein